MTLDAIFEIVRTNEEDVKTVFNWLNFVEINGNVHIILKEIRPWDLDLD